MDQVHIGRIHKFAGAHTQALALNTSVNLIGILRLISGTDAISALTAGVGIAGTNNDLHK